MPQVIIVPVGVDLRIQAFVGVDRIMDAINEYGLDPDTEFRQLVTTCADIRSGYTIEQIPPGLSPAAPVLTLLNDTLSDNPSMVGLVYDGGRRWDKVQWALENQLPARYSRWALFGETALANRFAHNSTMRCQEIHEVLSISTDTFVNTIDYDAFFGAPLNKNFDGPLYDEVPEDQIRRVPADDDRARAEAAAMLRDEINNLKAFYRQVSDSGLETIARLS